MKAKIYLLTFVFAIALVPTIGSAQVGKNTDALLKQILQNQEKMQADIENLKKQLNLKDKEISELRSSLEKQQVTVQEQAKVVQQVASAPASIGSGTGEGHTDFYSAKMKYDAARQLMHDVIFDVRKGEQKPWFERVISEFRTIVKDFPQAPEAQESQLRIARIYWRYLDDTASARKEFQFLLDKYPGGVYTKEAQDSLQKMK